jgi:hypothetical protein
MQEPKYSAGQDVLFFARGAALPELQRVNHPIAYCVAGAELSLPNGEPRIAMLDGWYYDITDHYAHESTLRPIIDPDAEPSTTSQDKRVEA